MSDHQDIPGIPSIGSPPRAVEAIDQTVADARLAALIAEEKLQRQAKTKKPRGYNPVFKIVSYGLTGSMLDYAGVPYGFWIGIAVGIVIVFFI